MPPRITLKEVQQLGKRNKIHALIKALSDEREEIRCEAVMMLGELGSKKSIKPLQKALNDENEWVRKCAEKALKINENKMIIEPFSNSLLRKDWKGWVSSLRRLTKSDIFKNNKE